MNKKNHLLITCVLGIIIVLAAVACWTSLQTQGASKETTPYSYLKNKVLSPLIKELSPIIQFLENLLGIRNHNASASTQLLTSRGHVAEGGFSSSPGPNEIPLNARATEGTNPDAKQGSGMMQQKNNTGNNQAINTGNSFGTNLENNSENDSEYIPEDNSENSNGNNPGYLSETNEDQGSGNLAETNADQDQGNLSESNTEDNSADNSTDNSVNNSDNNLENDSGDNSGGGSGDNSTGGNTENNSGSSSGNNNPSNLPTINPIPSDNSVSQSIAQQNQHNDELAALLASHKALVIPVQQQAQASKYQTETAQSIPPPSTNQAPDNVVQKLKSNQAFYH